jgi:signal transduction histidine kinase
LIGLRELIDRSLADVRLDAGTHQLERVCVAEFIEEIEIGALMQARARGLQLAVMSVDRAVIVEADRQVLAAALSNLLNNAFKFTRKRGSVALKTRVTADRVLFEVEDECGGLSPGDVSRFVRPLEQGQPGDRAVGLGLTVCLKAAKASAGEIHVRNLPGKGCVFTLALPRSRRSHLTPIDGSEPAAGEADRGDDATGSRLRRRTSA